jgi:predicted ATPase
MLCYLAAHPDRLVTKAELRHHVWAGAHVTDTVLRVCVQEIRAALGDAAATPQYLETIGRQGYRFLGGTEPELVASPAATPIVGRQHEADLLDECLQRAAQGSRQLAFISGEAGVGKTTIVDWWLARLSLEQALRVGRGQCVEHFGEGEPYLPLLEALGQLGRGPHGADTLQVLRQYAPMWLAQLPGLVSEAELERLQRRLQGAMRVRMMRELAEALEVMATDSPLVLVLEDLHWSDVSSVEFLTYVTQRRGPAQLLLLGTYRPVEAALQAHPLRGIVQELCGRGQGVELRLECLPAADVAAYVAGRLGGPVAVALAAFVYERAEGNALFMVNIVEHLRQQGLVARHQGEWRLREGVEAELRSLPEEVRQMLLRRIEALPPEVRQVLEAASVVGEEFSATAVAAGARCAVEDVEARCETLAAQHHFIEDVGVTAWPDASSGGCYRFQHTLYQQAFYEQLGTVRRMQLHRRIGGRLEVAYGGRAGEIASLLAVHFERGGETLRAVHYWQQVGENAVRRNAYHAAIAALRKALTLLGTVMDSRERTERELALQLRLGELLMAAQGMASLEAGEAYTRAHALCQQVGEASQLFQVLSGLFVFHSAQARLRRGREISQQLFELAQSQHDPVLVRDSHLLRGGVELYHGDLVLARADLQQCLELSVTQQLSTSISPSGLEPRIVSLVWLGRALWVLGYADQAQQRSQEALALARHLGHTPSVAYAEYFTAMLYQNRREVASTHAHAQALIGLAVEQGFVLRGEQGRILRGWALAMEGDAGEGIRQISQGLAAHQRMGGPALGRPLILALLAEAYAQAQQSEAGLQVLSEALTRVEATEERWWVAELYRLKGTLLLQLPTPDVPQADVCFRQALHVASRQQARALELRAAMSLSQLRRRQGQQQAAQALLAPIYSRFTEGFDTPDLQEARALLEDLS